MKRAMLVLLVLLAGCQRTLFSSAPAGDGGCAALLGSWQSLGDDRGRDGEVEATVAADCTVRLVEHGAEGPRRYLPLAFKASTQPSRWLWVDAARANAALAVQPGPLDRDGTVYALAWSLEGDLLTLTPPAHRGLAHRVLDGELDGAVHAEDNAITVRVDGDAAHVAALLAAHGTLDGGNAFRFRRVAVAAP
jgi:hypothetical protein